MQEIKMEKRWDNSCWKKSTCEEELHALAAVKSSHLSCYFEIIYEEVNVKQKRRYPSEQTFSGATSSSSAIGEVEAMVFRSTPWIWKARDMLLTRW